MASVLESFYPSAPVWAQNLGISLYGLVWRRERLGGKFDHHVALFQERDSWSAQRLQHYLTIELRRILSRAFREVPYYARTWREAGIGLRDIECMDVTDLVRL